MDGYQVYQIANAVNMHFNTNYDAFKYNFKTRVTERSYWGRPDKYQLTKIGKRFNKREDLIKYFAAHQVNGTKWVGDMIRDEDTYRDFVKRIDSLSYIFKNEIQEISGYTLDDLLRSKDKSYPKIIDAYLEDNVTLETVCILNSLTNFIEDANKEITETIMWPDLYNKVIKYQPFINFDREKFLKIVLDNFTS